MMKQSITITINGEPTVVEVEPRRLLLNLLREDLELTGTKEGCSTGTCGACTILIDGQPFLSCLTLAVAVDGRNVTTIEGLAKGGVLDPLQRSFVDNWGLQCGFCTPGMILSARALLNQNRSPSDEEIRTAISGNLCRCTGYQKIIEAIRGAVG